MANRVFQNVVYQKPWIICGVIDRPAPSFSSPSWDRSVRCARAAAVSPDGRGCFVAWVHATSSSPTPSITIMPCSWRAPTRLQGSLPVYWPSACRASSSTTTKSSISPTLSRTWCWTTSCPAISTLRHGTALCHRCFPRGVHRAGDQRRRYLRLRCGQQPVPPISRRTLCSISARPTPCWGRRSARAPPHRYGKAGCQHCGYPLRRTLHQGRGWHWHPLLPT